MKTPKQHSAAIFLAAQLIILSNATHGQRIPTIFPTAILKSVVEIDTQDQSGQFRVHGTGFMVGRTITRGTNSTKAIFLVTAKHVLSDWTLDKPSNPSLVSSLRVHCYTGDLKPIEFAINPKAVDPGQFVCFHPDDKVDVAMIVLATSFMPSSNIFYLDQSMLLGYNGTNRLGGCSDTNLFQTGVQVFAVGYPYGVASDSENLPLAMPAWVSSTPGKEFATHVGTNELRGKIICLGGVVTYGNSGGPVFIPPQVIPVSAGLLITEPWVIGICSSGAPSLSFAYSSDYILQLMDAFEQRIVDVRNDGATFVRRE